MKIDVDSMKIDVDSMKNKDQENDATQSTNYGNSMQLNGKR